MSYAVTLEPTLDSFVRRQIATGRFRSEADVLREGLRLLAARDEDVELRESIDAARRGDIVDLDEAFDELDRLSQDGHAKAE